METPVAMNDIVIALVKERGRQDAKWGEQNHSDGTWALILGEEFGEVCMAANEGQVAELRAELIQVAAVAVAWVDAIDRRRA